MPLNLEELLAPIPGDNPSGADLRYEPIYDEIKEARRQEDEAPQGHWEHARKTADWPLVFRLCSNVVAKQSKDLQIAAWLLEAALKQEGYAGLRAGLDLICGLLEKFWDTLYPEIEDGDVELRAAPLSWIGLKLDIAVRSVPLVRAGYDFFKYNESQLIVGYEATTDPDKRKAREQAIAEGKLAGEAWDKAFEETPKAFYKQIVADISASLKRIAEIEQMDERFGDAMPNFGPTRKALEEVYAVAASLLKKKLEIDPDPVEAEPAAGAAQEAAAEAAAAGSLTVEPVSRDDAITRLISAARYLRAAEPFNPAPYLILRGLRWGEVRASRGKPDPRLLQAPTTQLRSQLKLLLLDGKWAALLEAGENAMGQPCGRGWLDLQRYILLACSKLGPDYAAVESALRNALRAYLADVPELLEMTMMDDTPTANSETREWLMTELSDGAPPRASQADRDGAATEFDDLEVFSIARAGRTEEAVELLKRQQAQESTTRGRFRRKTQLAAVLVEAGREAIAQPILEDLIAQIDNYKLEEWESGEMVAEPLALLYRALHAQDGDAGMRQNLYLRICRLDPIQALKCPV
ncbi:MAG TPA: type VI secretion system protein TssA [Bryobacteraceae bacterium]|jgi:type VI secretion system protein ImpA|nr:type VI secretion system protein TssA [Bryobacteraceae bacterium]